MRNSIQLSAPAALAATANLSDLDLASVGIQGFSDFELTALNTAGTTPTLDVKLQHSDPQSRGYSYLTAGTTETKLKTGAATLVQLAATFTQSGAASVKAIGLKLKKIGTLAAGKLVTISVCADNSGAPGTVLGSATIGIDTLIGTAFSTVVVTLAKSINLANATVYHVTLSADYTASATNCVVLRSKTVASGGTQQTFDGTTWTAVTTEKVEVFTEQFVFADIAGAAFTQVTTGAARQKITLNAESLKRIIRPVAVIDGTDTPTYVVGLDVVSNPSRS